MEGGEPGCRVDAVLEGTTLVYEETQSNMPLIS